MLIAGLAGGIASGKSFVADEFRRLGAEVIDADQIGHHVLTLESVRTKIEREFGSDVIDGRGEIDRKKLAKKVFGNDSESGRRLQRLEAITHPEISRLIRERLKDLKASGVQVVILDAAVMFKSGWDKLCDRIVFVECDQSVRLERATSRGWTREQFLSREANQMSLDEKKRRSTDFVVNNGEKSPSIAEQVAAIWKAWQAVN